MTTTPPGDCWPTPDQTLLLRAALLPGSAARQAWEAWRTRASLADLDGGSRRLLPLLYRNLRGLGLDDPAFAEFKARQRYNWFKNQALFHQCAQILAALAAAGIPTLLLKGGSVSLRYYSDPSLRPMTDLDVLVPEAQARQAHGLLREAGWKPDNSVFDPEVHFTTRASMGYSFAGGFQLDLHQHVLWDCVYPEADRPFWMRAEPRTFYQAPTATLCATDDLVHTCIHAARYNDFPPVRWAADAMHILRSTRYPVEWERLLGLARDLRLSLSLHAALSYLAGALEAPIPAAVLSALEAMPVTPAERRFYEIKVSRPGLLHGFPLIWYQYERLARGTGQRPSLPGYLRFIQHAWSLPRARDIPAYGWRRLREEWARRRSQPAAA
jgi:hypothetical protein